MAAPSDASRPHAFRLSSARDEPRALTHAATLSPTSSPSSSPYSIPPGLSPEYNKFFYDRPREVVPGLLSNGVLTPNHPLVSLYLSRVPRKQNHWIELGSHSSSFFLPPDPEGQEREVPTLSQLVSIRGLDLSEFQDECIFALAALKVFYHARHRAHFSFWGKGVVHRTARRVQKILDMDPCPIASPISWVNSHEMVWWVVKNVQSTAFKPSETAPNKRYTTRNAAAGSITGAKPRTRAATAAQAKKGAASPKKKKVQVVLQTAGQSSNVHEGTPDAAEVEKENTTMNVDESAPTLTKEAKVELLADPSSQLAPLTELALAPLSSTSTVQRVSPATRCTPTPSRPTVPLPTRRSARQAQKAGSATPASIEASTLTPASSSTPTPPLLPETASGEGRPIHKRARSSSSSTTTVVGNADPENENDNDAMEEGGGETAVEEDAEEGGEDSEGLGLGLEFNAEGDDASANTKVVEEVPVKSNSGKRKTGKKSSGTRKRKRVSDEIEEAQPQNVDNTEKDTEEKDTTLKPTRQSTRSRKQTPKMKASKELTITATANLKSEEVRPAKKARVSGGGRARKAQTAGVAS
ncbi:hypothetical protein K474DRAFT_1453531 [Panus rudis PR-1116 ss-1]|nr:hypothetical protein K474DRAFT_1453531 [Panus rudis PR-1116 ss-1]